MFKLSIKIFTVLILSLYSGLIHSQRVSQTKKVSYELVAFESHPGHFFAVKDGVVYLEQSKDNKLVHIDANTGKRTTLLEGIARVYEDARPKMSEAHLSAGKGLLTTFNKTRDMNGNVTIYNEKPFEQWNIIKGSRQVIEACGDYAMIQLDDEECDRMGIDARGFLLVNLETGKKIAIPQNTEEEEQYGRLAPNGNGINAVYHKNTGTLFTRINTPNGRSINKDFSDRYLSSENVSRGYPIWHDFMSNDGYYYFSIKRRVYRIKADGTSDWEEYARIPSTLEGDFGRIAISSNGDILSEKYVFLNGQFDKPIILGNSGIEAYCRKLKIGVNECAPDNFGNFIINGSSALYIYNPRGVKNYGGGGKYYDDEEYKAF